jgi:hypothetical protein
MLRQNEQRRGSLYCEGASRLTRHCDLDQGTSLKICHLLAHFCELQDVPSATQVQNAGWRKAERRPACNPSSRLRI